MLEKLYEIVVELNLSDGSKYDIICVPIPVYIPDFYMDWLNDLCFGIKYFFNTLCIEDILWYWSDKEFNQLELYKYRCSF